MKAHISKLQMQLQGKNGKGGLLQTLQLCENKLTKPVRDELKDDPKEIILKIGTVYEELSDRWNAVEQITLKVLEFAVKLANEGEQCKAAYTPTCRFHV